MHESVRWVSWVLVTIGAVFALGGCLLGSSPHHDTVRQVSTLNALIDGAYESEVPVGRLTEGNATGLGTPNQLAGEMIILDGQAYRVDRSGEVHRVDPSTATPFAVVSRFGVDERTSLEPGTTFKGTKRSANALLGSENYVHALRVEGSFSTMKVRSVPRQTPPYRPLPEVIKNQEVFEYENVEGVLVGFRFPGYMQRLNAPGYHLHFLSEDRTKGGHVLGFTVRKADLKLDVERRFEMILPDHELFEKADLSTHESKDVEAVEKQR